MDKRGYSQRKTKGDGDFTVRRIAILTTIFLMSFVSSAHATVSPAPPLLAYCYSSAAGGFLPINGASSSAVVAPPPAATLVVQNGSSYYYAQCDSSGNLTASAMASTATATLPSTPLTGEVFFVSDSSSTSSCGPGYGGGTNHVFCYYTGSAWVVAAGGGGGGGGVTSINGTAGAFTFSGSGVSCTTTTCTFSGAGGGGTTTYSLTPGTGISGSAFNGGSAQTWTVTVPTSAGTAGYFPYYGAGGTSLLVNSALDDDVTKAGWLTYGDTGGVQGFSLRAAGTGVLGFMPAGNYTASTDTGLSRDSAGVIDFGNGTAADKSGSFKATNGTLSGSFTLSGLTGYLYANGSSAATASTTIPTSALSGTINASQVNGASVPTSKTVVGTNSSGQVVDATGSSPSFAGLTLTGLTGYLKGNGSSALTASSTATQTAPSNGTAGTSLYNLTATPAALNFTGGTGPTNPVLSLSGVSSGTPYQLHYFVTLGYSSATYSAPASATCYLYDSGTAAAISGSMRTVILPIATTLTLAQAATIDGNIKYTTATTGPSISIYCSVSSAPSAGNIAAYAATSTGAGASVEAYALLP